GPEAVGGLAADHRVTSFGFSSRAAGGPCFAVHGSCASCAKPRGRLCPPPGRFAVLDCRIEQGRQVLSSRPLQISLSRQRAAVHTHYSSRFFDNNQPSPAGLERLTGSESEDLARVLEAPDQAIDLLGGGVRAKACASGRRDAEAVHQRLGAVMPGP